MRALAVVAALALVVGLRMASGSPGALELSDVGQGLAAFDVADVGHVFLLREGLLTYAWKPSTTSHRAVEYCPRENVFWVPSTKAVYDRYGNPERFGSIDGDRMVPLRASIDADLRVHVTAETPTLKAPRERVSGAIMDFYSRWLTQDVVKTTSHTLVWCPNPIR